MDLRAGRPRVLEFMKLLRVLGATWPCDQLLNQPAASTPAAVTARGLELVADCPCCTPVHLTHRPSQALGLPHPTLPAAPSCPLLHQTQSKQPASATPGELKAREGDDLRAERALGGQTMRSCAHLIHLYSTAASQWKPPTLPQPYPSCRRKCRPLFCALGLMAWGVSLYLRGCCPGAHLGGPPAG